MRKLKLISLFLTISITPTIAQVYPTQKIKVLLQQKLDEFQQTNQFPGANLAVILPDGQELIVATGFQDLELKKPMEPFTRMLSGSNGKSYFAVASLLLMEQGYFKLDDLIYTYLKDEEWIDDLPNARSITFRHLLNHSSGLMEYYPLGNFMELLKENPYRSFSPTESISYSLNKKPLFNAGEGWSYADTNYILLGYILEKISGQNLYKIIQERILNPYKLTLTEPSVKLNYNDFAAGYARIANNPFPFPGKTIEDNKMRFNPQFEWAGGGFVSNVSDLAKWMKTIHSFPQLSASSLKELLHGVDAKTGKNHKYAMGLQIRPSELLGNSYGHSGWFPGYITDAAYFPDVDISIAIQFNTDDTELLKKSTISILNEFAALVHQYLPVAQQKYGIGYQIHEFPSSKTKGQNLQFQIWYPIENTDYQEQPYINNENLLEAMQAYGYNGLEKNEIKNLGTYKRKGKLNSSPIQNMKFPVVFFSHGHGMAAINYSLIYEYLVSKGYIVIAPDYELGGLRVLKDGTAQSSKQDEFLKNSEGQQGYFKIIENWSTQNEEILNLLKSGKIKNLKSALNFNKLYAMGHSLGGNTAAFWMQQNKNIKGAINLDGGIFKTINQPENRPLLVLRSQPDYTIDDLNKRNISQQQWEEMGLKIDQSFHDGYSNFKNKKEIKIKGAGHLSFSDAPFVVPSMINKFGGKKIKPFDGYELILQHINQFLEENP
ncbi:serine hydrolase [Pedobacter flavus]|uniref:Serine hydrolase n=1 Tax=Pedobacter flavus TaxID=3113906 RepID=A0ABU7H2F1_9SPHI|nr:serine hydrolase [Pedobacter sp. VNH31]MEE1885325.1 serine hydrolase [Pedobacter sp. VNH31]